MWILKILLSLDNIGNKAAKRNNNINKGKDDGKRVENFNRFGRSDISFADFWLETASKCEETWNQVPNSNRRYQSSVADVIVTQSVVCLSAGDRLRVVGRSTNANLGLLTINPANEPTIPGIVFTMFRIG